MYDIYVKTNDKIRYVLGTTGKNTLIVIGINPSTATEEKPDPTISRVNSYLKRYGYDSFKMINIYPVRATDPNNLPKRINKTIHKQNLDEIEKAISGASAVLCAWGNLVDKRKYLSACCKDVLNIIRNAEIPAYCLGQSKSGNPFHPLARVKTPSELLRFDIDSYDLKL